MAYTYYYSNGGNSPMREECKEWMQKAGNQVWMRLCGKSATASTLSVKRSNNAAITSRGEIVACRYRGWQIKLAMIFDL